MTEFCKGAARLRPKTLLRPKLVERGIAPTEQLVGRGHVRAFPCLGLVYVHRCRKERPTCGDSMTLPWPVMLLPPVVLSRCPFGVRLRGVTVPSNLDVGLLLTSWKY